MNPLTSPRCFLTVEAENDHTVSARILQLLTVRGDIPEWFGVRKHRDETLRVTVELNGIAEEAAVLLGRKLRNIPTVLDVSVSWLATRVSVESVAA